MEQTVTTVTGLGPYPTDTDGADILVERVSGHVAGGWSALSGFHGQRTDVMMFWRRG